MNANEEYWKLVESEQHFNNIQAGIRNRASTWLLAAFGAMAILLKTGENTSWLVPNALLVALVSLMTTVGLLVLWINDQFVYQRLLNSVFLVGLKREFDNSSLPPIRAMMMYGAEGRGMSRWMTLYYSIPMVFLLIITISVSILRQEIGDTSDSLSAPLSFLILVVICIIQIGLTIWVELKKPKVTPKERANVFNSKEFTEIFDETEEGMKKLEEMIARYTPKYETK